MNLQLQSIAAEKIPAIHACALNREDEELDALVEGLQDANDPYDRNDLIYLQKWIEQRILKLRQEKTVATDDQKACIRRRRKHLGQYAYALCNALHAIKQQ